ncbi:unnamed protein product [Calypogeia fissa]
MVTRQEQNRSTATTSPGRGGGGSTHDASRIGEGPERGPTSQRPTTGQNTTRRMPTRSNRESAHLQGRPSQKRQHLSQTHERSASRASISRRPHQIQSGERRAIHELRAEAESESEQYWQGKGDLAGKARDHQKQKQSQGGQAITGETRGDTVCFKGSKESIKSRKGREHRVCNGGDAVSGSGPVSRDDQWTMGSAQQVQRVTGGVSIGSTCSNEEQALSSGH